MDNFDGDYMGDEYPDYYDLEDDDYDGEDSFDFDDFDNDLISNHSGGSDVSSEESLFPKPEYSETTELRFYSLTQSPCGAFFKYSYTQLKWYGFDKNAKFVYGVLFGKTCSSKFQIVKYCPATSGFYIVKRYDENTHNLLGFDELNGTFFITKFGTVPSIILYNPTSDFETCYRFKDGIGFLPSAIVVNLLAVKALSCIDRQEWILFHNGGYFQRVIFDEDEKCVSVSERIYFPDDMSGVDQVFIHDEDTVIFVENWNRILVYNLENGQFNVADFTIDGITEDIPDRPSNYWLRKLNVTSVRDFYVSSQRYGVLKLDFRAKKLRCVGFSVCVDVSLDDLSNLVNFGDFVHDFAIDDRNCTLIGEPKSGCFCALFTEILPKSIVDKKRDKNGKKRKNKRKTEDNIAQIVCCLQSAWPVSLQDLCLSKLFGEFRKNKGAEKITDVEFCHQIGISPDLIQKYIGYSGV